MVGNILVSGEKHIESGLLSEPQQVAIANYISALLQGGLHGVLGEKLGYRYGCALIEKNQHSAAQRWSLETARSKLQDRLNLLLGEAVV